MTRISVQELYYLSNGGVLALRRGMSASTQQGSKLTADGNLELVRSLSFTRQAIGSAFRGVSFSGRQASREAAAPNYPVLLLLWSGPREA